MAITNSNPINSNTITADGSGDGLLSDRQSLVTSVTATQVAVTDALDGATFTGTALTTSSTPTVDELEAIAGSLGLAVNAAGTDIAALVVAVDAILDVLIAHGLMSDS